MGAASTLPKTHLTALRWLHEHGGEGVLDQYGALVAGGERYKTGAAPVWLRLFTMQHVEAGGKHRIRLSESGRAAVGQPAANPAHQSKFTGARQRAPMLDEEDEA